MRQCSLECPYARNLQCGVFACRLDTEHAPRYGGEACSRGMPATVPSDSPELAVHTGPAPIAPASKENRKSRPCDVTWGTVGSAEKSRLPTDHDPNEFYAWFGGAAWRAVKREDGRLNLYTFFDDLEHTVMYGATRRVFRGDRVRSVCTGAEGVITHVGKTMVLKQDSGVRTSLPFDTMELVSVPTPSFEPAPTHVPTPSFEPMTIKLDSKALLMSEINTMWRQDQTRKYVLVCCDVKVDEPPDPQMIEANAISANCCYFDRDPGAWIGRSTPVPVPVAVPDNKRPSHHDGLYWVDHNLYYVKQCADGSALLYRGVGKNQPPLPMPPVIWNERVAKGHIQRLDKHHDQTVVRGVGGKEEQDAVLVGIGVDLMAVVTLTDGREWTLPLAALKLRSYLF